MTKRKATPKKQTTPAGAPIPAKALAEEFDVGYSPHHPLHSYYSNFYVGDGYGRRRSPRNLPVETMLEMLLDHRVAIGELFVRTPLLNAPWRIECSDPQVKAFLEAVWSRLHDTYFRLASKAVMLGFVPLLMYLDFAEPEPTEDQRKKGIEPWKSSVEPVVATRLQVLHPMWCRAHFDPDTKKFDGIDLTRIPTIKAGEGLVPLQNSVWVTRGQDDAFGDWMGQGRIATAYSPWWDVAFIRGLYLRHCERTIDPPIVVKHPAGYEKDPSKPHQKGEKYSKKAMEAGQALRSGSTVTLPSTPYQQEDGTYTNIPMWDVDTTLGELENVASFETVLTRLDADVLMGLLIPPAAISTQYAKETLGGKSMTEILGKLATKMLLLEWVNLADNAEVWILDRLARWNFGEDAPKAQLVTDGFREEDVEALMKLIGEMVRIGAFDAGVLDDREMAHRAGLPLREEGPDEEGTQTNGGGEEGGDELSQVQAARGGSPEPDYTEEQLREVARRTIAETSPEDLTDEGWEITQEDIARVREAWGDIPELEPYVGEEGEAG